MKKAAIYILLLTGMITIFCIFAVGNEESKEETEIVTKTDNLHNGDAKFWNDRILTNVGGKFCVYKEDGTLQKRYDEIPVNWLDVCEESDLVVYGNFQNEIGIIHMDKDGRVRSHEVIMKTGNLQIDPTITKVKKRYYMSVTEIAGNINNADKNKPNGTYTIHFYTSKDARNWKYIGDIATAQNNLEDVDIYYFHKRFYVTYEKEKLDKGDSGVYIKKSLRGTKWSREKELLAADCDHEPAMMEKRKHSYRLYYSCDKDKRGKSYMGAKIYYADYDKHFKLLKKDMPVDTQVPDGILLYDIKEKNDRLNFLFARDYLTDCDMIIEREKK